MFREGYDMPISLVLRRERGEDIRRAEQTYLPAGASRDPAEYPLLSGVDPYANTIFNARQMHQLLVEVDRLLSGPLGVAERASLEAVADLCRDARRVHRYLWFIGD